MVTLLTEISIASEYCYRFLFLQCWFCKLLDLHAVSTSNDAVGVYVFVEQVATQIIRPMYRKLALLRFNATFMVQSAADEWVDGFMLRKIYSHIREPQQCQTNVAFFIFCFALRRTSCHCWVFGLGLATLNVKILLDQLLGVLHACIFDIARWMVTLLTDINIASEEFYSFFGSFYVDFVSDLTCMQCWFCKWLDLRGECVCLRALISVCSFLTSTGSQLPTTPWAGSPGGSCDIVRGTM